jgi:hypothetical protein
MTRASHAICAAASLLAFAPMPVAAATVSEVCHAIYANGWKHADPHQSTAATINGKPVKGQPLRDVSFGTCILRATDHASEPPKGFARNDYSRRQAFNADSSLFLVTANDGFWHLYDASTLAHVDKLPFLAGDAEPQWHPSDPALLRYLPRNGIGMTLEELDVRTGRSRRLADFGERLRARWPAAAAAMTRSEGSPSADGNTWCLMVDDASWRSLGVFSYDLKSDRIVGMLDTHGDRPDHVSASPGGKHCVVSGNGPNGTTAYSVDFARRVRLHHRSEHSDLAIDAGGRDVYVSVDYQANRGDLFMVDIESGRRTDLLPTYVNSTATALHVSGRSLKRPGWIVLSTYANHGKSGVQWLHQRVLAVQLKAGPRVIGLADHQSRFAKYWTEPHASVDPRFTRVLFNSNWNTGSATDVDAYMIVLPPQWLP